MNTSRNAQKRAVLYLRYSTQEQGDNLYTTIDAQRSYLLDYAAKNDYVVVGEYLDEAISGRTLKRKGYKAMRTGARAKAFDAVLITFMDRLGRGRAFTIAQYELGEYGVAVVHALQDFGQGVGGYIHQSARQMIDGVYPELVREWTEAKIVWMLKEGYHCCGRPPFGYDSVPVEVAVEDGKHPPKRLVSNQQQTAIVIEAMRRAADREGKASVRRYLVEVTGETWSYDRVTRLLTNRVYLGEARWGQHVNTSAHLPIVDAALFNEVQEAIRTESKGRQTHPQGPYYLRSLVRCSCGRTMTPYWSKGRSGEKYFYYQCMGYRTLECRRQVSAPALHSTVFVESAAIGRSPWRTRQALSEAREKLPSLVETRDALVRLRREASQVSREKDRFIAAIRVSPTSVIPTLTVELSKVEENLRSLKARIAAEEKTSRDASLPTIEECQKLLTRLGEIWSAATEEERCAMAPLLIDDVVVYDTYAITGFKSTFRTDPASLADLWSTRGRVRALTDDEGPRRPLPLTQTTSNPFYLPLPLPSGPQRAGGQSG